MQRRTILQMVLSSVALCFAPLTALVRKKVPPLRGHVSYTYRGGGSVLQVTGTPEQLCEFYRVYQNTLWPQVDQLMGDTDRDKLLAPLYEQVRRAAKQTGHIQVIMQGYSAGYGGVDPYTHATGVAVLTTRCILTEEATRLMQLHGTDIPRLPSCTEERC